MLLRQVPTELIQEIKLKEAIEIKKISGKYPGKIGTDSKKNQRTIKEEERKNKVKAKPKLRSFKTLHATSGESDASKKVK